MRLDVSQCDALLSPRGAALLAAAAALADSDAIDPATIERLRRVGPEELVAPALEVVAARKRAARKIERADRLLCDVEGVEQASGTAPARHKAARFRAAGVRSVLDVCCGIGGDAMELAAAGLDVTGVNVDPGRARMTAHNAGSAVDVRAAEDLTVPAHDVAVHVDPARRIENEARRGGRRLWRYGELRPGPDVVERLVAGRPAAIKLGPGVELDAVPKLAEREVEILGDAHGLVQCVVWCGALASAPGCRTATRLSDRSSFTGVPDVGAVGPVREPGRFLFVPDAALERARLVRARFGDAGLGELAPGLGVLTGDEPIIDRWLQCHRVLACMPWRESKLAAWLREHDGGEVIVRTRAGAIATDRIARALRGSGKEQHTVFGLRLGRRIVAIVTRRES